MGVQINGDTGNVIATKGTFSGDVGIGGTLTYEDVTNIDSVGLITARTGIEIGARPGVAASVSVDGNAIFSGITTVGGNLMVGDNQIPDADLHVHGNLLVEDTIGNNLRVRSTVNNGNDPNIRFQKGRGGGTPAVVQNGDDIGDLSWAGYDGDTYVVGADILGEVEGTPSDEDMPMRLTFKTRSAGAGSAQGRLRISADGTVSLVNDSNLQIPDKIIHDGDTDTTIRFPDADTFSVETAGSERLRIDSSGNIGISTESPTGKLSVGKVGAYLNRDGITVTNPHSSGLKNGVFVLNESGYNSTATYRAAAFKAVGASGIAVGVSTDQGSNGLGGTLNYNVNFDGKTTQAGSITANGSFYHEESGETNGGDTQDKTIEFNRRGIFLMLISYSLGTTTTDINRNVYSLGLFVSRSNGASWVPIQQDLNSSHVGNLTISDASVRGKLRIQKSAGSDARTCAFRIDVLSSADVAITVTDT